MIPRRPLIDFPFLKYDDQDVINGYNWLRSYIPEKDWLLRKDAIEKYLSYDFRSTQPFSEPLTAGTLLVIKNDQIGWYLYLLQCLIFEPHKYEYYQGARIVPVFKRIGMNLDMVKKIGGINKKVRELTNRRRSEADAIFFEILTALMWVRNGWQVSFLEEGKGSKSPDLFAIKNNESWQIECKRQRKSSDYTYKETEKRQIMASYISEILLQYNVILDITFHVELISLPNTYLKDLLRHKIPLVDKPGKLISNNEVDINVEFVNIERIKNHLAKFCVKDVSPQLLDLIANRKVDHAGFTSGILGNFFRLGDGEANNLYISHIEKAFGIHWLCDAEQAIDSKARDIKKHLTDAIEQFNLDSKAVIHIGMETFDGPEVEKKRFRKISKTLESLKPNETNLRWIYYHFFQSYSRSNETWIFDETVDIATSSVISIPPIKNPFLVIPEDVNTLTNISHWNRRLP